MSRRPTFAMLKGMRAVVESLVIEDVEGTMHSLALTLDRQGFYLLCDRNLVTAFSGSQVKPNAPLRQGAVTCLTCLSVV